MSGSSTGLAAETPGDRIGALPAAIAVMLSAMLSSLGWILEGEAIARLHPVPVACVSLLAGGTILLLIAAVRTKRPARVPEHLKGFLVFSVLRNVVCGLAFAYCLTLTSSAKVMFLTKLEPYIVLLVQWALYRRGIGRGQLTLLAVHVAGAIILSTGGTATLSEAVTGDLLVVGGITINALTYGPAERYSREFGALWASGGSQLIGGAVLAVPTVLLFSESFTVAEPLGTGWYYVALTVLTFYVLSSALWFFSLRGLPAWLNSALRCVGPVVAAPIAWIVYDRVLSPTQLFGAAIVIATSAWMVILEQRPAATDESAKSRER